MKITIIAHPNSKNPRISVDMHQTVHIYVSQPPLEGKANQAVIEALSEYYKVSKSKIKMVSGEKSKSKVFVIDLPTRP